MKVKVKGIDLQFDTLELLLKNLREEQEQQEMNEEINISFEDSNLTESDFKSLVIFFSDIKRKSVFHASISSNHPLATLFNQTFNDIFLANQREHYAEQVKAQVLTIKPGAESAMPPESKLRKNKLDLVRGIAPVGFQIQQQQQQQQQQQTTQAVQRRIKKPKENVDHDEDDKPPPLKNSADLGELINRTNIYQKLREYSAEVYKNADKYPDLMQIWDALVGPGADKITDKKRIITQVEVKAMELIVRHYPQFAYGVIPDNLPIGFYLQETIDREHVLCYNDDPEFQRKQRARVTPLTIKLNDQMEKPIIGTYQQFIITLLQRVKPDADMQFFWSVLSGKNKQFLKDYPQVKEYKQQFNLLIDDQKSLEERKGAFLFFINELIKETPQLKEAVQQLLTSFKPGIEGLAHLLISHGERGVLIFLKEMSLLKENGLFTVFNETILAHTDNYYQFITDQGLSTLEKLKNFDSGQRAWWISLVTQHIEAGNPVNFNELFESYNYFLNELSKMGLDKLPLSCPLTPIKNMNTALDRALYILKTSQDSKEQLACLQGLDFSSTGAYLAARFDDFSIFSKEMHLSYSSKFDGDYQFPESVPYYGTNTVEFGSKFLAINKEGERLDPNDPLNSEVYNHFSKELGHEKFAVYNADLPLFKGYILIEHNKPNDQELRSFHHLDFSLFGEKESHAVLKPVASKDNGEGSFNYNPPSKPKFFDAMNRLADPNNPDNVDLATAIKYYYRYVGKHGSDYTLDVYQKIEELVLSDKTFTQIEKAYFLSLVAISTTANSKSDNPVQDAANLIKIIQNMDVVFKKTGQSYLFKLHHIKNLQSNEMLSLDQLGHIINFLQTLPVIVMGPASSNIFLITIAFAHDIDRALGILDVLKKREKIAAQNTTSIHYSSFLEYSHFLLPIVNSMKELKEYFGQEDADQLISLLPLLDNNFSHPREGVTKVDHLVEDLKTLNPQIRSQLLAVLNEINIEKSYKLPSIEQIQSLITNVKDMESELLANDSNAIRQNMLRDTLRKLYPETTFGNEPVNESLMGLVQMFKGYLVESNPLQLANEQLKEGSELHEKIKGLPIPGTSALFSQLKKWTEPVMKAYKDFEVALSVEPVNVSDVLQKMAHLEACAQSLIDKKLGVIPLKTILKPLIARMANEEDGTLGLEQFIEKKKLLTLIQEPLESRFKLALTKAIKSLQTGTPEFDKYLQEQLGTLNIDEPIDKALSEYSTKFNEVNGFINLLIHIRNHNENDYRKLIKDLNGANINQIRSFSQMYQLIRALEKQNAISVSTQLNIILDKIKEYPGYSATRYLIALEQLDVLAGFRDILPPNAYKTLLKVSFKYNLAAIEGTFPIAEMAQLKAASNIDKEQAEVLFDNMVRVIQKIGSDEKNDVKEETINTVINQIILVTRQYSVESSQAIVLASNLLKLCKNCDNKELLALKDILTQMPSQNRASWLKIMTMMSAALGSVTMEKLADLPIKLMAHANLLPEIASLFDYRPYPPLDRLLIALNQDENSVKDFITQCDKDPKLERVDQYDDGELIITAEEILTQQFSTGRVHAVVSEISEILEETKLSHQQQYDLAQKVVYITAIGKDHPVKIGDRICNDLTKASRSDLSEFSQFLIKELRNHNLPPDELRNNQLKFIAVLREMYFRSTGKFPRTTQILSLLLSLDNPENLLMEINTGEGKSITTALLAVLQWVNGGTVDVCTANRGLVTQDYFNKGTVDFFDFLKIPSAVVHSDSEPNTYKVGGINYSTVADLSLYYARARFDGENLTTKDNKIIPCNLILDESDYTTLDDRTLFNYAIGAVGGDNRINPHAWIYPLMIEFINQSEFRNTDIKSGSVWTREEDIQNLKIFLDKHAKSPLQRNQLFEVNDKKFDKWLNAACVAQQLVKGNNFIIGNETREIDGEERTVKIAVPLIQNNPQFGASFSDGVQQFLHAILAKSEPELFPIDAEMLFVSTQSAKDFVDHYHASGRIVGISGTVGTRNELIEQHAKFGMKAISIPSHEENKRVTLGDYVKKSNEAQVDEIKKAIGNVVKKDDPSAQPTLLICKDINQARALHNRLKDGEYNGRKLTINIVTGEETEEERERLIKAAGNPNTITIATSLLGRGTDIDPLHKDGLFVIQCYLDTERTTRQILGRAARNGKVGQYLAIYDENGLTHRHEIGSLMKMNSTDRKKALTRIQLQMNEEGAIERHYIQEVAAIQQVMLKQFEHWEVFLKEVSDPQVSADLKTKLASMREELISGLSEQWKQRLDASNPNPKLFPNAYVRRGADNKLITKELNEALAALEQDAADIWEETSNALYQQSHVEQLSEIDRFQADHMRGISISEELKVRKLEIREETKAKVREQKNTAIHLRHALDVDAAVLKFSEESSLSPTERKEYQQRSIQTQLQLNIEEFNAVIQDLPVKKEIKQNLKINDLKDKTSLERVQIIAAAFKTFETTYAGDLPMKFRMQPALIEFLEVFEQIKKTWSTEEKDESYKGLLNEMNALKANYIDNVATQVINQLQMTLSWAKKGNKSWDSLIERSSVKNAARNILQATDDLQAASETERLKHIRNLYKVLQKESAKLDGLWIFSFGHKDTRKLINNTLKMLDNITRIAEIPMSFKNESHEQAIRELYVENLVKVSEKASKQVNQSLTTRWSTIISELETIKEGNNTLYVMYEIQACLNRHRNELSYPKSPLLKPLQSLRLQVQHDIDAMEKKYPHLLTSSQFLIKKQDSIMSHLKEVNGIEVEQVTLNRGHTGFSEYYELVVKAKSTGDSNLFSGFTSYNDRLNQLMDELTPLKMQNDKANQMQEEIERYIPMLQPEARSKNAPEKLIIIEENHLSPEINQQVETCNKKIALLSESGLLIDRVLKENDPGITVELQALVTQCNRFKDMNFMGLNAEQAGDFIPQFSKVIIDFASRKKNMDDELDLLHREFQDLTDKKNTLLDKRGKQAKEKDIGAFFSKLTTAALEKVNVIDSEKSINKKINKVTEAIEKKTQDLEGLGKQFISSQTVGLKQIDLLMKEKLSEDIQLQLDKLLPMLEHDKQGNQKIIELLQEKIKLLEKEIHTEQNRSGIYSRRFLSLNELFEFDAKIRKLPSPMMDSEVRGMDVLAESPESPDNNNFLQQNFT